MIQGNPKFDGLAVGELTANFMGGPGAVELKAKIAFVSTKTGVTHGSSLHAGPWSSEVLAKLRELADVMEQDLARHHLEGTSRVFGPSTAPTNDIPRGIGQHFGSGREPRQAS